VRLDITVENKSQLSFVVQNRRDNAKSALGAGILSGVPARGVRTVKLMPRVDADGIEQGISGRLELICQETSLVIPLKYDFLANQCTYAADVSDTRMLVGMMYLGKSPDKTHWGLEGAHRLLVTIDCCGSDFEGSDDDKALKYRLTEGLMLRSSRLGGAHSRDAWHTTW